MALAGAVIGAIGVEAAKTSPALAAPIPVATGDNAPAIIYPSPLAAASAVQQRDSLFGAAGPISPEQARNHVLRRATWGPRPSERAAIEAMGIDGWLDAQVHPAKTADPAGTAVAGNYNKQGTGIASVVGALPRYDWTSQWDTVHCALARRLYSSRQLFEIVVDVMGNHLNVPLPSDFGWSCAADYHESVLRPNAMGSFTDLLMAAMRHPAILQYFSDGSESGGHLNENLGREVLELHTVGIESGFTEADVQASARILTGRTVDSNALTFTYRPDLHITGAVTVLGFSHANASAENGLQAGDDYLRYLANHPSTGRMIARKLATRFVSDAPSDDLLDTLAQVYASSGTRIDSVVWAIFCSSEFWQSIGQKTRRPSEDVIGTFRGMDHDSQSTVVQASTELYWRLQKMGDTPFGSKSQRGYPDTEDAWLTSESFVELWTDHRGLAAGWWPGIIPPADAFAPTTTETIGSWLDRLGSQSLGFVPTGSFRTTLLQFVGATEGANAATSGMAFKAGLVTALLFDSPFFRTR